MAPKTATFTVVLTDADVQRIGDYVIRQLRAEGLAKTVKEPRACAYEPCGAVFTPGRRDQKYHSDACRLNAFLARRQEVARVQRKARLDRHLVEAGVKSQQTLQDVAAGADPEIEALADEFMDKIASGELAVLPVGDDQ